MCLEQEEKSQYRAEGIRNFFLDGKKQSLLLRNRGEWRPSPVAPPQALTGSPLAGLSPSLLIPAPQPTLAALAGVSRPCSSSPPREPAGPDMLIALCPGPCPARLLCLSWRVPACCRPGCLLGFSHAAQCGLLCVSRCWTQTRCSRSPCSAPGEALHSLRGRETGSMAPANQEHTGSHRWDLVRLCPRSSVRASLTHIPEPLSCVSRE